MAITTVKPRSTALPGSGSNTAMTAAPIRPARIGASRPARSDQRPATGLMIASTAADTRNTAPMAAPEAPRSSIRSGTSTSITPAKSAGIVNSQKPAITAGRRSVRSIARTPGLVLRLHARHRPCPRGEPHREQRYGAEDHLGTEHRRRPAEHRAEQHADDRGAERSADQLATAVHGRGGHEPGHAGRPHAGSADPLDEARAVEQHDVPCEGEGQAREAEQCEPGHQRRLDAPADREPARGQRADERAGRVGGGEDARAGLREVQLVGVMGQERGHGSEEHGVHEHHRSDEPEEPAHPYDAT